MRTAAGPLPCLDSEHTTVEEPTPFPTTSRSAWSGSRRRRGLSWAELNRRLAVHPQTMRRWRKGRARPSTRHMMALLDLADGLGLGHIFTD